MWTAYQLERTLRGGDAAKTRFTDVAHGGVVIEYVPPRSFSGGTALKVIAQARDQANEYAEMLAEEEGRPLDEYSLIVWDGAHISFGRYDGTEFAWEPIGPFSEASAARLLQMLMNDGAPLVHPRVLSQLAGPDSDVGSRLLPKLYTAVRASITPTPTITKTRLLYIEWRRLFGQVVGLQSDRLKSLLSTQGRAHGQNYEEDPAAYLYALNTYIAVVAKMVAAMSLRESSQDIADGNVPIASRIDSLESGRLFANAGVLNMLNGDFFAWYQDDQAWPSYSDDLSSLIDTLNVINFDVSKKNGESTRDLFKGIYMSFVPRALRHALGEYYTPDWLAEHALDQVAWSPEETLLDPTAGSGTFMLEALKRRLAVNPLASARLLLDGLWGLDLNPLAVLAARASLVVFLSDRLDPADPIRLPVFLADAINPARATETGVYEHELQTEMGLMKFRLPVDIVSDDEFFSLLSRARDLIDADYGSGRIMEALSTEFDLETLPDASRADLSEFFEILSKLHLQGWNGIWCAVLGDRFAAGSIPRCNFVVGNPPWVKWSHLPPEYANLIKARCLELGVFSVDRWVGGIESDISTVITYEAVDKYLVDSGRLAFFITGTVFANESSQGFRRWRLNAAEVDMRVDFVEDFAAVAPFEGVRNHATLLGVTRGAETSYPVAYRVWTPPRNSKSRRSVKRSFKDSASFRAESTSVDLQARPVPGSDAGPWLKGTRALHDVWAHLFGQQKASYRARKGVTTDANGIFFVRAEAGRVAKTVAITNDSSRGRRRDVGEVRAVVESEHVFPLVRGEGISAFKASPDPEYRILVPQREMHGDPDLPSDAPRTHRFLARFEEILESRSSYKRFQMRAGAPYWSLWSTGEYTFSPYKVAWRELGGGKFAAAYMGHHADPILGRKIMIPDHKLYFVPCASRDEAAYLTGFLNAPIVAGAVSAYAAQLSLGASVVEYLLIPSYDESLPEHVELAGIASSITESGGDATPDQLEELDGVVCVLMGISDEIRRAVHEEAVDPVLKPTSGIGVVELRQRDRVAFEIGDGRDARDDSFDDLTDGEPTSGELGDDPVQILHPEGQQGGATAVGVVDHLDDSGVGEVPFG